jgi:tight adherence protein B
MRPLRARVVLAFAAAALLLAPAAATAEDTLQVNKLSGAGFPDRAFVLTLPSQTFLTEDRVQVRENGELVSGLTVVPAEAAESGQFAVVLVIDASNSMRGEAIEGAFAAARAFAAQRNENQKVSVVTFNSGAEVLLPLTASQAEIDAAVASPTPLAKGTHVYDAVETALSLLADAKVAAGSIIVLSDGADTGSRASAEAVAAAAREAHVRIFSVGLRSPSYDPKPLERMAAAAGGSYSEAGSTGELEGLFDHLGSRLANEYLLQYRSSVRPDTKVKVSITVDGVDAIAVEDYVAPALGADAGAPFHRSFAERFWKSGAGMLATTLLAAALVALAVMAALRPRTHTLRKRMAEFVSLAVTEEADSESRDMVVSRTEKTLERTAWWTRFAQDLELAEIRTPAVHIVLATAVGTVLAVFLLYTLTGSLVFAPLGLAVPFIVRSLIRRKVERKRRLFADQLPDNLQVLASALRAGHSLVGALSVVVDDCPEPSRSEFGRIVADEQLGVPLEEAFGVVSRRMDSRDLEQVALVAALQRETGGNTAEVLDRVAETIRSRFELRRLVKTLTTQGRMSRWVVSLLPVGLLVLITLINPEYMKPLYVHPLGRVLLLFAGVMVVAGSLVIKRIINIKV